MYMKSKSHQTNKSSPSKIICMHYIIYNYNRISEIIFESQKLFLHLRNHTRTPQIIIAPKKSYLHSKNHTRNKKSVSALITQTRTSKVSAMKPTNQSCPIIIRIASEKSSSCSKNHTPLKKKFVNFAM